MTWLLNLAQAPGSRTWWSSLHTWRKKRSSVSTLTTTHTRRQKRSSALTRIKHHLSLCLNVLSQSNDVSPSITSKINSFFFGQNRSFTSTQRRLTAPWLRLVCWFTQLWRFFVDSFTIFSQFSPALFSAKSSYFSMEPALKFTFAKKSLRFVRLHLVITHRKGGGGGEGSAPDAALDL